MYAPRRRRNQWTTAATVSATTSPMSGVRDRVINSTRICTATNQRIPRGLEVKRRKNIDPSKPSDNASASEFRLTYTPDQKPTVTPVDRARRFQTNNAKMVVPAATHPSQATILI